MKVYKLLSRNDFRELVFQRDGRKCVICKQQAVDAHHIIERRLWPDGGYYLDNGVSVCEMHHIMCERTDISVEDIRTAAGIVNKMLPPHLYTDQMYDKWGNPILPNGRRLKGELFYDESVQKILNNSLSLFDNYVKYPRTYHLPWSAGMNDDDRQMPDTNSFNNVRVIVTEKMDGENTTMYTDHIHARSIDSSNHESRSWVKQYWGQLRSDIPDGWRICGENLYAKHSILYDTLPTYFLGFSVWNKNICLSWDDTIEWMSLLNITPVPVLYDGIYDAQKIKALWDESKSSVSEGYVIRNASEFSYDQFRYNVGKFVRKDHIQTVRHWLHGQRMERNLITK